MAASNTKQVRRLLVRLLVRGNATAGHDRTETESAVADAAAVIDPRPELPSTVDLAVALDGSPGSRVPHAWADGVSTLDMVASRLTLLVGPAGDRWLAAAADVGLPAHRVCAPWLSDAGALLVRPDAVVAMQVTAPAPDPARFLADDLDQVLASRGARGRVEHRQRRRAGRGHG
ncbi:hypothetical protein LJ657_26150 [Streptomyces sp. NR30]|uniref:Uncharacterized protein n=1 Tax=Streptomyces guryensis TaxID=2886947 RepID=A0A9Q3VSX8_9ACTN|nr:hypothetical protein [Streptomyces guryensis]MCD9877054.1 hypothetical protein [Streptomyces guryensis]